jgi:two-component system LytT family response regulator
MTDKLRVIVADDELMARKRLLRLLEAIPDVEVCGECLDGAEVLRRIKGNDVDVLLLDIRMPGLNGLDVMRQIPPDGPHVIFCTAHSEHAVQAFDVNAVDYLLKPVEAERLVRALERARKRACKSRIGEEPAGERNASAVGPPLTRLPIDTRHGIVLIDPKQVSHAELDGELVKITTQDGEHLTDSSLQDLEAKLPATFMRVHRRALVNLEQIVRLEPCETGGFLARMARGDGIQVSRQAARHLRRMLGLRRAPEDKPPLEGED